MARYAIGDIQGCCEPLRCLLDSVAFDPAADRLLFTGDLVNRGPDSLGVLRLVHDLGDAAVTVLGNHDLHLLAVAAGVRKAHRKDTMEAILEAPDRDRLLDWLRHCPLIHVEAGYLLVHAGLAPQWSVQQAMALAKEVEQVLQGSQSQNYFATMYGNEPDCWDDALQGPTRWRVITNYLTRMRFCHADGGLDLKYKGDLAGSPADAVPWFTHPERRNTDTPIVFGHWAALQGRAETDNVFALDTGCVWGGQLRMMRLEDQQMFHCDCG